MEITRQHNRNGSELTLKFSNEKTRLSFALSRHEIRPKGRQVVEVVVSDDGKDDGKKEKSSVKKLSTKTPHPDWFTNISEQDKAAIFMNILDYYRARSEGDKGIKAAAIGVFKDPKTGKTRLFIGMNTKRQHPYFKDCAELNMMNAATHALSHVVGRNGNGAFPKPSPLEVHVMGGSSGEVAASENASSIICPCGKCIDMFAYSTTPYARFYTYPVPRETIENHSSHTTFPYEIVGEKKASHIGQIDPERQIWQVPFDRLNKDRALTAAETTAALQEKGLEAALEHIKHTPHAPPAIALTEAGQGTLQRILGSDGSPTPDSELLFAQLALNIGRADLVEIPEKSADEVKNYLAVITQATTNAANRISSIPALDVARAADGSIDLESVNKVMVEKILATMASRLRGSAIDPAQEQGWQETFLEQLGTVRCAVIELENGTFHYGLEVQGALDSSMPNAEVNALMTALEALGDNKVKQVFVMEMNPAEIARPDHPVSRPTLHTSPKEGIERIFKRSLPEVPFHFLPFNDGALTNEALAEIVRTYTPPEIYPGGFGKHTARQALATDPPSIAPGAGRR
jgi:hypothetical protein